MAGLTRLAMDELTHVAEYLSADELRMLWHTGDALLQLKLRHATKSLRETRNPYLLPQSLACFNALTFIKIDFGRMVDKAEWLQPAAIVWPPTLRSLSIQNYKQRAWHDCVWPSKLQTLHLLPGPNVLAHLPLEEEQHLLGVVSEFWRRLPASLIDVMVPYLPNLVLPANKFVHLASLKQSPFVWYTSVAYGSFALEDVVSALKSLPPSLTSLDIRYAWTELEMYASCSLIRLASNTCRPHCKR
jgi:hypothetical protein